MRKLIFTALAMAAWRWLTSPSTKARSAPARAKSPARRPAQRRAATAKR